MKYILGIDVGGTTTKVVGFDNERMIGSTKVQANDPLASLYGAFGKFTTEYDIPLAEIERVMITGVGSSFVKEKIFGIPTGCAPEFSSTGLGGLYLSGLKKAIVCSIGTGTAFVKATCTEALHMGGTGVGGGTLLGLAGQLMNIHNFENIIEMASEGDISNIDLKIGDISKTIGSSLDLTMTAANFGKVSDMASKPDIALGLVNLVCETIGMMAVFAVRGSDDDCVVLTGSLVREPMMCKKFMDLSEMLGIKFIIPQNAEFATAVGASLVYRLGWDYEDIKGEKI